MAFGKCSKCPSSARSGLLIGGYCHHHYANSDDVVERSEAPKIEKAKIAAAKLKTLDAWFKEQIAKCPSNCENCGKSIIIPADMTKKAAIAHILPKKLFASVKTNDNNRLFLCLICHTNFDNRGNDHAASMPVAKLARERFALFKDSIAENEKKNIPAYLVK